MSSRPLLRPQKVVNAVSLNASAHSLVSAINMISSFGYTLAWGAGASGDFSVEVSNDFVPTPPGVQPTDPANGTWVAVPLVILLAGVLTPVDHISTTGSVGSAYLDIDGISAAYARLTYTKTSGSGGTFTVTIAGKVQ